MIEYINSLEAKHRATREALLKEGKTHRSRFVAQESGYLNALSDIKDSIERPQKNAALEGMMAKFTERLRT